MARRAWVLDTETKGTGAEMVPLDKVQKRRKPVQRETERASERPWRRMRPKLAEEPAPQPRQPRKFKVVDVMSRRSLLDEARLAETLGLLRRIRSVVDVTVYVRERPDRWRALTFGEQKLLWDLRERGVDERQRPLPEHA
jgi:hypothetical protein